CCCVWPCSRRATRRRFSGTSTNTSSRSMRTTPGRKDLFLLLPLVLFAPALGPARAQGGTPPDTSIARGITAGEADADMERRNLLSALHFKLGFTTLRIGGGVTIDYMGYDQDRASRGQFPNLPSQGKLRDARI